MKALSKLVRLIGQPIKTDELFTTSRVYTMKDIEHILKFVTARRVQLNFYNPGFDKYFKRPSIWSSWIAKIKNPPKSIHVNCDKSRTRTHFKQEEILEFITQGNCELVENLTLAIPGAIFRVDFCEALVEVS